jgi:hypothetical protein
MNKKYLILSRCEDEVGYDVVTKSELNKKLQSGEYEGYTFLDGTEKIDLEYFPSKSVLIMAGEFVIPKPKKVVTEWEV